MLKLRSLMSTAGTLSMALGAWATVVPNTTTSYTMTGNESFTGGQTHWDKAFNIDMGGCTLTMNTSNQTVWFENASDVFKNGTLVLDYGYQMCFSKSVTANDDVTLKFKGTNNARWLTLNAAVYAGNLYWDSAPNKFNGSNRIYVKGTFTPIAAKFHNVTMQNGSTLDLSSKTAVWSTTSSGNQNSNGGNVTCTCNFASGSVTVKPGNWALSNNQRVIAWSSIPASVTFIPSEEMYNAGLHYVTQSDGLYTASHSDPVWAKWDTTTNGWKFYGPSNTELTDWTGGVTQYTEVRIGSPAELAAIRAATAVTPRKYSFATQTLAADADYSAAINGKTIVIQHGGTINLNGHKLYVADLTGTGTITDSSTGTAGELHAAIGAAQSNYNLLLSGNLKFYKEGSAQLKVFKAMTYTGGTVVSAGTLRLGSGGGITNTKELGNNTSTQRCYATVNSGATLDINSGHTGWGYHTITLNGGTLKGASTQPNFGFQVTADSTVDSSALYADFGSTSLRGISPVLNGNTLTLNVRSSYNCYVSTATGPGTIRTSANGWGAQFLNEFTQPDPTKRFDLDHRGAIGVTANIDVKDYYANYSGNYMTGTGTMRVYGTFVPTGTSFYGCELQDGSTLDLSAKTAVWSTTRTNTNSGLAGNDTATFAANSEILVKLGGWAGVHGQQSVKVVAWVTQPAATVNFVPENSLAEHWYFAKRDDGLYLTRKPGITLVIR